MAGSIGWFHFDPRGGRLHIDAKLAERTKAAGPSQSMRGRQPQEVPIRRGKFQLGRVTSRPALPGDVFVRPERAMPRAAARGAASATRFRANMAELTGAAEDRPAQSARQAHEGQVAKLLTSI